MTTHSSSLASGEAVSPTNKLTGFLRLGGILAPKGPLPISKSSWWAKVRSGEYPQPIKLGPRTTAWRASDIMELIARFEKGSRS